LSDRFGEDIACTRVQLQQISKDASTVSDMAINVVFTKIIGG